MMGMLETRQEEYKIFKGAPGSDDPFYSDGNMRYLERKMEDYKAERLQFAEHELMED
jgi:hypothetical protein